MKIVAGKNHVGADQRSCGRAPLLWAHRRTWTVCAMLLLVGLCVAGPAQSATVTWNFDVPTGAVATPHTYLDTTSVYSIVASGYTTEFESPMTANLGDVWATGTITPNALYGKLSSPPETGLGLDGLNPDHEIQEDSFVQLDLINLFVNGLINLTMTVSSIQAGEGYYLWGSNVQGIPGVLLKQGRNPADGGDEQTFLVPQYGAYRYISVSSTSHEPPQPNSDVLIRNGLTADPSTDPRRCLLPITFTTEGWATYSNPNSPVINGGMVYNRFSKAFSCFSFKGVPSPGKLIVGGKYTITYTNITYSLQRLCTLFAMSCTGCDKLKHSLVSPWQLTPADGGGCLAVETITLLMNVAYNDMRLMPKTPGVDLECYTLAKGLYKGKTVAEVFNIANAVLAGDPLSRYGLKNCAELVDILEQINANYEFVGFPSSVDWGYLVPNKPFERTDPPHCPSVPMVCR